MVTERKVMSRPKRAIVRWSMKDMRSRNRALSISGFSNMALFVLVLPICFSSRFFFGNCCKMQDESRWIVDNRDSSYSGRFFSYIRGLLDGICKDLLAHLVKVLYSTTDNPG